MIKYIQLMRLSILLLITFFSLLTSVNSFATDTIYKWIDAQGNVHYGDMRPENQKSEEIRVQSSGTYVPLQTPQEKVQAMKENTQARELQQKADMQKQRERKRNQKRCLAARKNLIALSEHGRARIKDKQGYRYLTPKEMTQQRQLNKKIATQACAKNP